MNRSGKAEHLSVESIGCAREERVEFDFSKWNTMIIKDPKQLQTLIDSFRLIGRTISDFRFVSHVYNYTEDGIEDMVWNITEAYPEDMWIDSTIFEQTEDTFPIPLNLNMDEPVLIGFEDGNQFEVLTPVEGAFIVSMNEIPWNAEGGINSENINGSVLFDTLKGMQIFKAEVVEAKIYDGGYAIRLELKKNRTVFTLLFESTFHSYMDVTLMDDVGCRILNAPFFRVKQSMYT